MNHQSTGHGFSFATYVLWISLSINHLVFAEPEPSPAPVPAVATPVDMSDAKIEENITGLISPKREQRQQSAQWLEAWATKESPKAKQKFLFLLRDSSEPEIRERSMKLLRALSIVDYENTGEGYIGITMGIEAAVTLPGDDKPCYGVPVSMVTNGGPAELSGIKAGDMIVTFDGRKWRNQGEIMPIDANGGLRGEIRAKGAGKKVTLGIWRDNALISVDAVLGRRPANLDQFVGGGIVIRGGGVFLNGGAIQQFNQPDVTALIEEDKNSDAFFKEWLFNQMKSLPPKN
jgi:hypothetical protein